MSWLSPSWADEAQFISAILTPVGFLIAGYQLHRQADASEAVIKTAKRLNLHQAVMILPQLESIDDELHAIVREGSLHGASPDALAALRERGGKALALWRQLAGRLRELLSSTNLGEPQLLEDLKESLALAGAAKADLSDGTKTIKASLKAIRSSTNDVCAYLGALPVGLLAELNKEDN